MKNILFVPKNKTSWFELIKISDALKGKANSISVINSEIARGKHIDDVIANGHIVIDFVKMDKKKHIQKKYI